MTKDILKQEEVKSYFRDCFSWIVNNVKK